jgi:hypothetical protein
MPAAATLPPVPDLDGRRWCRHCSATLPLASFPAGRRRYICRKHVWQCVTKPSKTRCLQDPRKNRLWLLWKRCWTDARTVFKQARVGIVQGDIDALLRDVNGDGVSVMPADPTRVLCTENAVLVQTPERPQLVRAWRAGGAEGYALELAACVSVC